MGRHYSARRCARDTRPFGAADLVFAAKKKGPGAGQSPEEIRIRLQVYFSAFCTLVKVPLRFVPTPCTATMMATEMPAAMRPYSIAVAPDSFLRDATRYFIESSSEHPGDGSPNPLAIGRHRRRTCIQVFTFD